MLFAKEAKRKYPMESQNNSSEESHNDYCKINHLEFKINNLTELLCSLCKRIELELPIIFTEETRLCDWWEDHKANDKAIEEIKKIRGLKKELDDLEKRLSDYLEKA